MKKLIICTLLACLTVYANVSTAAKSKKSTATSFKSDNTITLMAETLNTLDKVQAKARLRFYVPRHLKDSLSDEIKKLKGKKDKGLKISVIKDTNKSGIHTDKISVQVTADKNKKLKIYCYHVDGLDYIQCNSQPFDS